MSFGGSKKTTTNQDNRIINDYANADLSTDNSVRGEYAGVGGNVTHDESRIDFDVDNSIEVENDGQFAGSTGNISILDGGAIESSFDFATIVAKEGAKLAESAISKVSANAESTVNALVKSQDNAFNAYDKVVGDSFSAVNNTTNKTMDALEDISGEYAASLTDFSKAYTEGISEVQIDNMSNNKEQLSTIAELAKSTSLQGQDIVAENSTKMIMYVMGGLAFLALIGGAVVLMKGSK